MVDAVQRNDTSGKVVRWVGFKGALSKDSSQGNYQYPGRQTTTLNAAAVAFTNPPSRRIALSRLSVTDGVDSLLAG